MLSWIEAHAIALAGLSAAVFILATVPRSVPDAFARSAVERIDSRGVSIGRRSLIASRPGPEILNSTTFRSGVFSIEFVLRTPDAQMAKTGSIISYARGPSLNWGIDQIGTSINVVHRNRESNFPGVISADVTQHFIAELAADATTLYLAGEKAGTKAWTGSPRHWRDDGRIAIGNVVTGDFPFTGRVELLNIYEQGTTENGASERFLAFRNGKAADDALLALQVSNSGAIALVGAGGDAIPLDLYPWPWSLKLRRVFDETDLITSARDVVLNVLITAFFGFFVAAYLRGLAGPRVCLVVTASAFGMSLMVETLQLFSPWRVASLIDLATNTAGALIGSLLFLAAAQSAQSSTGTRKRDRD